MEKVLFIYHFPLGDYAPMLDGYEIVRPQTPLERFSEEELMAKIGDADALVCAMDAPCGKALIEAGKKLKAIGNVGVGYNNIDVEAASKQGIYVINTPNEVTDPTAELTIALMLACTRSIALYDRNLRKEHTWTRSILLERDMVVTGRKLGILGFGRIGRLVAKKAVGLGMQIVYNDLERAPADVEQELNATFMSADEVIKNADVLSLHMPYTAENHHYMNEERFQMMKPTSYLVNAARGSIVSEKALIKALTQGWIRGAGLDVHENEPHVSPEVAALENVVLTPHVGTNLAEVRMRMLGEMLQGLTGVLKGECPYNVVNPDAR